jgi:hypothetical protein
MRSRTLAGLLRAGLAIGLVTLLVASAAAVSAAPPQQTYTCRWKDLGNLNRTATYPASAMDTDKSIMHVYGGFGDASQDFETQNAITGITFGATLSRGDTGVASINAPGSKDREALAGAYRPKGDDSAIYWIAGRDNTGTTSSDVQVYHIKAGTWSVLATTGSFGKRNEHAAAYDPKHDVIWVAAGTTSSCASVPCTAPTMPTSYLSFDPATGAASWHDGPSGGPRAKGGSMVYDAKGERMLLFGGTIDGVKGTDQLYQLDLKDPDVAKAKWSQLAATGTAPQVAAHGAAYDAERNWMVVAGGMKTNYGVPGSESGETRTFALDLSTTPPSWRDLRANVGDAIQGVMEYVPKHKAVVITGGRGALADPVENTTFERGIRGLECTAAATPTPTRTPSGPVATNTPGGTQPTAAPQPTVVNDPMVCESIKNRVPAIVINDAVAQPNKVYGYGLACNPGLAPVDPWNPVRRYLTLRNMNVPYNPVYNGVVWSCGCR